MSSPNDISPRGSTPKTSQSQHPTPSLFLGPPSGNTSNVSLPPLLQPGANAAAIGAPTVQRTPLVHLEVPFTSSRPPRRLGVPGGSYVGRAIQERQLQQQRRSAEDRTDALWAEMQNTLAEVELSASHGSHVFGVEHAKALEELRTAQIALAQAWARSEADDVVDSSGDAEGKVVKSSTLLGADTGANPTGKGEEARGHKLEEETEKDILVARKRREANDRYFQRVNGGVLDVVSKLEEVAAAMRAVERESKGIWAETDSMESGTTG
ncbi:MAG: hypothetical protein M1834_004489 [Cirrosporium novae-zelandiae]|nr:MAG: hypothetical protein M1834_004489 [Cirrosporium novae-zelandiae]